MSRLRIEDELKRAYPDVAFDVLVPPDPTLGDYSTNVAFTLAKRERRSPLSAAADVAALFGGADWLDRVEVAPPGFVNFFLKREFLQQELARIHAHRDHYGARETGEGQTVIVEYSSPNIAKPMHVGHLRSTVIGDALANVYELLGYKVIRWNYLGDWGTQFGKLIAEYKKQEKEKGPGFEATIFGDDTTAAAVRLYVQFHKALSGDPALEKEGREEFMKLERGDKENKSLWIRFRDASLLEFQGMYHRLGVHPFDVTKGESAYEAELKPFVAELRESGRVQESEGALIFPLEQDNLPPALLVKSDGASLYITRDLVSLRDRVAQFHPAEVIYVVANQQALHFEQLFAIARELGLAPAELEHVKFGMVLGEDGKKFSTREGNAVELADVLDKISAKALEKVREKNPELSDERTHEIADVIGVGALKYADLRQHPHSDIVFDWDAMLDLSGNSGPYLQYTYARLSNILAKAPARGAADVSLLELPQERALMRHLLDFPYAVERAAEQRALTGIALYLYELANLSNRFYECVRVLDDDHAVHRDARLLLVETVAATLGRGLKLLGITPLERI